MSELFHGGEKKVEYIELIYDLIFVYLVGRNNALLHTIENGFFTAPTYAPYIVATLVILQVWYFSSLFINRYGTNGRLEHIGIFINMYLLYYMAQGTRVDWQGYYTRYNVAWGLIVLNLAGMYLYRRRVASKNAPWEMAQITSVARTLLIMAGLPRCVKSPLITTTTYSALSPVLAWFKSSICPLCRGLNSAITPMTDMGHSPPKSQKIFSHYTTFVL